VEGGVDREQTRYPTTIMDVMIGPLAHGLYMHAEI